MTQHRGKDEINRDLQKLADDFAGSEGNLSTALLGDIKQKIAEMTTEEKDAFLESTERVKRVEDFLHFLKYFNKMEDVEAKRTADMAKIQEEIFAIDREVEIDTKGQGTLGATTGVQSRLTQSVARKNERKNELLREEEKLANEGIDLDAIRKDVREMYLDVVAIEPKNGEKLFYDIEKIKDVSLREGLLRDKLISQLKARKQKSVEAPVEIPIKFEEVKTDEPDKDDKNDPSNTEPKMPIKKISQSMNIVADKPVEEVKREEIVESVTPFVGVAEIGIDGKIEGIKNENIDNFNQIETGTAGDSKPIVDSMPAIDEIIAGKPVVDIQTITEVQEPQTKEITESLPDSNAQMLSVDSGTLSVGDETRAFLDNKLDFINKASVETPKELMSNNDNITTNKPGFLSRLFGRRNAAASAKTDDLNSIFWDSSIDAKDDSEKWEKINAELINEREVANEQ